MTKAQAIFNRFIKGFVASAIPIIVGELSGVAQFNNATEVKTFLIAVAVPILTGALLAFEKALNWVEPEKPIEIEEVQATKTGSRTQKTAKKKTAARKTA